MYIYHISQHIFIYIVYYNVQGEETELTPNVYNN